MYPPVIYSSIVVLQYFTASGTAVIYNINGSFVFLNVLPLRNNYISIATAVATAVTDNVFM